MNTIFTIGHSNRTSEDFVALLTGAGVKLLADVRAYPASRRHPHFSREALAAALQAAGIEYLWLGAALGGHREARPDSVNTALPPMWRGYADHMQAPAYAAGLAELEKHALELPTAVMCAERNPPECHRNLIADSLYGHSWCVVHLIGADKNLVHAPNPEAKWSAGQLRYPGAQQMQLGL